MRKPTNNNFQWPNATFAKSFTSKRLRRDSRSIQVFNPLIPPNNENSATTNTQFHETFDCGLLYAFYTIDVNTKRKGNDLILKHFSEI